ncbi:Y-family DNA polymerase [Priestia endophytica]|uniref:DNA polymerase V n=1 Tax=Priestia endophytica DSM 13796 TaxID=1121089 RepID=A0A1I6C0T2_9BACI|nr:damage repair protein [Priestia endophytica]KYG33427.1 damage repair protein [Priestia endophytica]SFQ86685.1 DNA polymerase V [Priestia endophytica DSM 13796]
MDYEQIPNRIIMCIDMKSFFASVSCVIRRLDPLKTRLAVVGDTKRSGSVVLAATPLLKKEGIKTGSRLFEIPKRKDIHVVNPSMERYVKASNYISSLVLQYVAPEDFHAYSIDELFIDVTASLHLFARTPEALAHKIIHEIYQKTRLTATIGIGPNLLLAKVSLDHEAKRNPRGIAYWRYEDVPHKLWSIYPMRDFWGISSATERRLNGLGIQSLKELALSSKELLQKEFGVLGTELHQHANGIDYSRISEVYIPHSRSFGKSQILLRDYTSRKEIELLLLELLDDVCFRLRLHQVVAQTIHLSIGYSKQTGKGFSRQKKMIRASNLSQDIFPYCLTILHTYDTGMPIRSIGISLSNTTIQEEEQMSLFEDIDKREKAYALAKTVDEIRTRYGKNSLLRASSALDYSTARYRNGLMGGHKA